MTRLSHRFTRLSIQLAAAACGLTGAVLAGRDVGNSSPYYGRWTVSEERPAFTARGLQYKTIDFAPCGRDFCGVSVAANGTCGPTLFRFLTKHNDGEVALHGHGKWGNATKNIQINNYDYGDGDASARRIEIYLGDGYDFGDRSDNMPKYHSEYRRTGGARCTAR